MSRRTVLRDVDALTEAGLPIITHQGNQGGIELGFNYRTRLTGLLPDEAEAMAVILSRPTPELRDLGLEGAGARARAKMLESFPDGVRETIDLARRRFQFADAPGEDTDPRITALATAIRRRTIVRIRAHSPQARIIHPISLIRSPAGWRVVDAQDPEHPIALEDLGDINISRRTF